MSNTGIDTQSIMVLKCTSQDDEIFICDQYYSVFYTSNDQGANWNPIEYPFENAMYVLHALGNDRLLFQTDLQSNFSLTDEPSGLYLSENAGLTWTSITNEIDATFCMSLATAGNDLFCSTSGNGVYKSSNNGLSWSLTGLTNWQVRVIRNLDGKIFAGGSNGIHCSSDGGATWVFAAQGLTNLSVNDFVHIDDNLFAATADGVFMSTDEGALWSSQSNGITTPLAQCLMVKGTTLYAGTSDGVFVSTNYGNSWQSMGSGLPPFSFIYSIVHFNSDLLITTGLGIYRLLNGSTQWELVSQGSFAADAYRLKVVDDKIFANRLAPVVGYDGVFVSFDGGTTWEGHSVGLTNNTVFEIERLGNDVYAATLGSGCFKRAISEFQPLGAGEVSDAGIVVYPNPAHDRLVVQVTAHQIGLPLAIYNVCGERVLETTITQASHTTVDTSAWPSGYYIVRVGSAMRRVVVN